MNKQVNCNALKKHKNLMGEVHFELLETINYKNRDYYFLSDALLRKRNNIFKPNGFFSIMENGNFDNFVITKDFTHYGASERTLSELMGGAYNEIECGKINNENYDIEYDNDIDIFKWDDLKTSDIIDSFLQYEFNNLTFKDFIISLFPEEENNYIMLYFQLLNSPNIATSITYIIKVYKDCRQIYVNIYTGFYGIA
jgi:hypothetical protein